MLSFKRLAATTAPGPVVIVRMLVGWVFLSEGIQKFLFPSLLGVGRFTKIGIPAPEIMVPFVGGLEIVCGALVLLGLLTRLAALLLLLNITVALLSTKLPVLLGHGYWLFKLPSVSRYGVWAAASEARTDLSMFLGSLFLVMVGAGTWSLDAWIVRRRPSRK
jgi:putative oxidoreductase